MHISERRRRRAGGTLVAAVFSFAVLPGCGGGPDGAASPGAVAQVDPRFASAEAILDHYNRLSTTGPRVDFDAIFGLMYAENALQGHLVRIFRHAAPYMELDQACWESFGGALFGGRATEGALEPYRARATMTETGPDRARATQLSNDGVTEELYLVRIGDRWWLSGYSIEYDPEFDVEGVDLDKLERAMRYLAVSAPAVTAEVRRGTWDDTNPEEGRQLVLGRLFAQMQQDHGLSIEQVIDVMLWGAPDAEAP